MASKQQIISALEEIALTREQAKALLEGICEGRKPRRCKLEVCEDPRENADIFDPSIVHEGRKA